MHKLESVQSLTLTAYMIKFTQCLPYGNLDY